MTTSTPLPEARTARVDVLFTGYPDRDVLRTQRERVLAVADLVVPGHGAAFVPEGSTPH